MEQPLIDKQINLIKAQDSKKIQNQYLDNRTDIMKNTQVEVEHIIDKSLQKKNISQ